MIENYFFIEGVSFSGAYTVKISAGEKRNFIIINTVTILIQSLSAWQV
jgi:hypothetical protein